MEMKSALFCNADCRQSKASGGTDCHDAIVPRNYIAAIFISSGLRIGLLPEEEESCVNIVRNCSSSGEQTVCTGDRRWLPFVSRRLCQRGKRCPLGDRQTQGDAGHRRSSWRRVSAICVRVGILLNSRFVDAVDFHLHFHYAHSGLSVFDQAADSRQHLYGIIDARMPLEQPLGSMYSKLCVLPVCLSVSHNGKENCLDDYRSCSSCWVTLLLLARAPGYGLSLCGKR